MARRGFSLIELIIVVAIVAILAVLMIPTFTTRQQSNKVESALKQLRAKVERARVLSTEIGPRIGEQNAPALWSYGANCTASTGGTPEPAGYLWAYVGTNGDYSIPAEVTIDRNPSSGTYQQVQVRCDSGTIADLVYQATQSNQVSPTVLAPASQNLIYSFTGSGRLCVDTSGAATGVCDPTANAEVIFQHTTTSVLADAKRYGFRIFQSGMLCTATLQGVAFQCDTD